MRCAFSSALPIVYHNQNSNSIFLFSFFWHIHHMTFSRQLAFDTVKVSKVQNLTFCLKLVKCPTNAIILQSTVCAHNLVV
jgi:hypothetical protein